MARSFELDSEGPNPLLSGSVCTIGVFDGVHEGHRLLIGEAVKEARRQGVPSVIVTFAVDPDEVLSNGGVRKILSNDSRLEMLGRMDADYLAVLPFDEDVASMGPDRFLDGVFGGNVPRSVFVGSDFRYGREASGDVGEMSEWGTRHGMEVHPVDLLQMGGEPVKSTRIRELLAEGRLEDAERLTGRPYSFKRVVTKGRGEGGHMGFATANMRIPDGEKVIPDGVYGGYVTIDGTVYQAAVSVGIPPMFEDRSKDNLEVHVLGFDGDLYGREMEVQFAKLLRPMIRFDDVDSLVRQVNEDIAWIQENL